MNIATGVFTSIQDAEDAIKGLRSDKFDDVGLFTRDRDKGMTLSRDLQRDFRGDEQPPDSQMFSDNDIYGKLPDKFRETIHKSDLTDDAIPWYEQQLTNGNVLVVVDVGNRMSDADRDLTAHHGMLYNAPGAVQRPTTAPTQRAAAAMPSTPAQRPATPTPATPTPATGMRAEDMSTMKEVHVPIIEEEVVVEKTTHQVGEVDVESETTTRSVDIPMTVIHEQIRVERRRLDHPMRPEEYPGPKAPEGAIHMPVVEDEVRMVKRPIIREELVITRVPVEERRTLHEQVMHTEPRLDTTGEVPMQNRGEEPPDEQKRPAA